MHEKDTLFVTGAIIKNLAGEILILQELTGKPFIKEPFEWGIPLETCKVGEDYEGALSRLEFEEVGSFTIIKKSEFGTFCIPVKIEKDHGYVDVLAVVLVYELIVSDIKIRPDDKDIGNHTFIDPNAINGQYPLRPIMPEILDSIRNQKTHIKPVICENPMLDD